MKRWVVAGIAAAGVQAGTTIALPAQSWSMPMGMAVLAALCAAATLSIEQNVRSWRRDFTALGFLAWSLMWVAFVVQDHLFGSEQSFALPTVVVRYVCFIVVLLPLANQFDSRVLRILDVAQGLIFAVVMILLVLPGALTAPIFTYDRDYMYLSYAAMVLLALVSVVTQPKEARYLNNALLVTLTIYTATSIFSIDAAVRYSIPPNSPIWVFGDIVYLAYLLMIVDGGSARETVDPPLARTGTRYHLAPLLLATLLLFISIEIGHTQPAFGFVAGLCALLLYAARSTLLERYYHQMQDRVIELERARSQNMIEMVHEVRGALGGVVMNVATLRVAQDLPPFEARIVDSLHRGCSRTTTLLRDVLDLERLEANLVRCDKVAIDMVPVIDEALADVEPQARELGITLEAPRRDCAVVAMGDIATLNRVLLNLLQNAIRFTPAGGRVAVAIAMTADGYATIAVADTGVGIAGDVQPLLFKRFGHRGEPVNGQRGSGLGLSITKALVESMDGTLMLSSVQGQGTTVTVKLAAAAPRLSLSA